LLSIQNKFEQRLIAATNLLRCATFVHSFAGIRFYEAHTSLLLIEGKVDQIRLHLACMRI